MSVEKKVKLLNCNVQSDSNIPAINKTQQVFDCIIIPTEK